jgi:two-component system, chemotaxis family, protein-glutamate methylesterase/glutaminase
MTVPLTDRTHRGAIVLGASAGAFDALSVVLSALPATFPFPVLAVVHMPPDRDSALAELLGSRCRIPVREAEDKETAVGGTIYLAPRDYHLLMESDGRLSLSGEEPVRFSRPSIDVLFETAADAYGPNLIGVVLTGANNDGARGLRAILDAGGIGLVQRPELAHAPTMPAAAIALCPTARVMTLPEIGRYLQEVVIRA